LLVGVYPAADDSITLQEELDQEENSEKSSNSSFIPWNKRASFIAATYIENPSSFNVPATDREGTRKRTQGRFSSFRRVKSSITTDTSHQSNNNNKVSTISSKLPLRRMNSLDRNTLRSLRSSTSTLRRQNSENNSSTWRKNRIMSTNSLSKQPSFDYPSMSRDARGKLQRKSSRFKLNDGGAQSFFDRYQDTLRVEVFSMDLNKFSLKSNNSSTTKSVTPTTPLTPTSLDEKDSVFDYNEESLSKEFDYKLVGKTYQQLFYIRSRLSASARKTEFMCDGSFGCEACDLQCYPTWNTSS